MFTAFLTMVAVMGASPLATEATSQPSEVSAFGGVAVTINQELIVSTAPGESRAVTLATGESSSLILELERFEVFSRDATIVAARMEDGRLSEREVSRPDIACFRGHVRGDAESQAFFAIGATTVSGYIREGDSMWVVAQPADARWTAVYDLNQVDSSEMRWIETVCQTPTLPMPQVAPVREETTRGIDCPPRIRLAIETDWQFTNLFGGDTEASGAYAATLIGAVSSIYHTDLDVGIQICYLRLWENSSDPWSGGDSAAQLSEFSTYWNSNMDHVERHLAHMLSGQGLGGGIAYVSVVCTSSGYAVSGNLAGSFPIPIEDHSGNNWDLMVVAHEIGHNCGTLHTHDYNPPIDGCGNGDCSDAWGGTIMSYCHLCSGGISNMVMSFHPTVQTTIENFIAGLSCDLGGDGSPPTANVDEVDAIFGEPFDIDVLMNDYTNDCSDPFILTYDTDTLYGGTVELIGGSTGVLRYNSPPDPLDIDGFFYEMSDDMGQSDRAGVLVHFILPKPADSPTSIAEGVDVRYYELDNPSVLPDFGALTPIGEEVLSDVDLPSTNGQFAGSGLSDDVGAVFEGLIEVPSSSTYTLFVESDDGSRLYIGNEEVVDNDGLHGMNEESGEILLAAGLHRVRVEFFERGGGAGVIVRIEGGGLPKQVIPADRWWRDVSVLGDATGDGLVNIEDILLIVSTFGDCTGACMADLDDDGDVDVDDLLIVMGAFQTG
ncbi:MAG: M12 family metallo-peptidase [Phycisphaerales bacterium]|nr:M12 family metallo-peptidase [Phycisphaerales bacterium]